jgi:hypothetical protein
MPEIRHKSTGGQYWRSIELKGNGTGLVVIAGFKIGSLCNPFIAYPASPAISGTGFDELHVVRCHVRGPTWCCLQGVATGTPAMTVTIPYVVIAHSDLQGGPTVDDIGWYALPQGPPSVDVTGALAILDSVIQGSPAQELLWNPNAPWGDYGPVPPQPCPCPQISPKNHGGPGVKATVGFVVNSLISGGPGGAVKLATSQGWVPFGSQPWGEAWTDNSTVYEAPAVGLTAPLPMQIGQPWSLAISPGWNSLSLYASLDISVPYAFGAQFGFMQNIDLSAHLTPGTTSIDLTWPNSPALLGIEIVWQVYDPILGLSRPVFDIMMP